MADAVKVTVIADTPTHHVVMLTNVSDGVGEAAVVKVDKSALLASDGAEPASLDIERVEYSCNGMVAEILWDHTTDDMALALGGTGAFDYKGRPHEIPGKMNIGVLADPRSAGGTGDILVTTVGHTAGDTYNILLVLRKQPD